MSLGVYESGDGGHCCSKKHLHRRQTPDWYRIEQPAAEAGSATTAPAPALRPPAAAAAPPGDWASVAAAPPPMVRASVRDEPELNDPELAHVQSLMVEPPPGRPSSWTWEATESFLALETPLAFVVPVGKDYFCRLCGRFEHGDGAHISSRTHLSKREWMPKVCHWYPVLNSNFGKFRFLGFADAFRLSRVSRPQAPSFRIMTNGYPVPADGDEAETGPAPKRPRCARIDADGSIILTIPHPGRGDEAHPG